MRGENVGLRYFLLPFRECKIILNWRIVELIECIRCKSDELIGGLVNDEKEKIKLWEGGTKCFKEDAKPKSEEQDFITI